VAIVATPQNDRQPDPEPWISQAAPADHPVARIIHQRLAEGSRPGARRDECRVGLAIEGGGTRGVVSGGMLAALEELGLRDAFDVVYGSSAGSFNATYFLAGQASDALTLYVDDMTSGFLDVSRLLRRQPLVSLDWVLDVVMCRHLPLDWTAVLESPIPLRVIASSVDELEPVVLSGFSGAKELRTALAAGASIPFLAGPPVEFRGQRLLDAAVLQAHPYESAMADGCTHVLSLSTRPRGRLRERPGLWSRITALRLNRLQAGLGARHLARIRAYGQAQRRLWDMTRSPHQPPFGLDVAPAPDSAEVRQLERDPAKILAGARAGYEAAMLALTGQRVRAVYRLASSRTARQPD